MTPPPPVSADKSPRVLVVDDEPQILRSLTIVLRGAGYAVEAAATSAEALERVEYKPRRHFYLYPSSGPLAVFGAADHAPNTGIQKNDVAAGFFQAVP